jgi:hypothetical protein
MNITIRSAGCGKKSGPKVELNSFDTTNPKITVGLFFLPCFGKSDEDTIANLASFGDYACAILSNKFAELACLFAAKNAGLCLINRLL